MYEARIYVRCACDGGIEYSKAPTERADPIHRMDLMQVLTGRADPILNVNGKVFAARATYDFDNTGTGGRSHTIQAILGCCIPRATNLRAGYVRGLVGSPGLSYRCLCLLVWEVGACRGFGRCMLLLIPTKQIMPGPIGLRTNLIPTL